MFVAPTSRSLFAALCPVQIVPLKELTLEQLAKHDGSNPDLPLYLSVQGTVYNIEKGRQFYGPDGEDRAAALAWQLQSFCRKLLSSSKKAVLRTSYRVHWHLVASKDDAHQQLTALLRCSTCQVGSLKLLLWLVTPHSRRFVKTHRRVPCAGQECAHVPALRFNVLQSISDAVLTAAPLLPPCHHTQACTLLPARSARVRWHSCPPSCRTATTTLMICRTRRRRRCGTGS